MCSCCVHTVLHILFFAFVGASRLWNHPVFESRVQQSCGAGEHLQGASADHSGKKRTRRLFSVSRYWTCLTFLFLWPTVHPPRWCSEAGPGWTAGHRWGCSHPSPSGQETARALSGFHGLHHQWVRNGAFFIIKYHHYSEVKAIITLSIICRGERNNYFYYNSWLFVWYINSQKLADNIFQFS